MAEIVVDINRTILKQCAWGVFNDDYRFICLIAGRRFGKTYLLAYLILKNLLKKSNAEILYLAPTYQMAKRVMWRYLIRIIPEMLIKEKVLSDMQITLCNGSIVYLGGSQNYDSYRGLGLDYALIDEGADVESAVWSEVVRPALSDKQGSAIVAGTPEGKHNWLYELTLDKTFKTYQYTTMDGGWVDEEEIEQAKEQLDERTFRQEYLASFESWLSTVYYAYSEANNCNIEFNPELDTYLCWDFNVGECPMACILNQKQKDGTYVCVQEFVYPHSNTDEVCQAVVQYLDNQNYKGPIYITGDWAGRRRESSASFTDYQIIDHYFKNYKDYSKKIRPTLAVKDRTSALNALFKNYKGEIKQYINASRCPKLVDDLLRVEWKSSGVKLDDTNKELTHPSDALSYFAYNYHPTDRQEIITKMWAN